MSSPIQRLTFLAVLAFMISAFSSCNPPASKKAPHPLVGAWLATDGTIFDFREDGTFHGIDFRKREIWGNWVKLSETRIGFQSLLHKSYYHPQYAIIDSGSRDRMNYIVSDGQHYIQADRIAREKALAAIEVLIEPNLPKPRPSSD